MRNSMENRVPVDIEKLSHGLRTTFIGVAEVFDSIGAEERPGFGVVEETTEEPVENKAEPVDSADEAEADKAVDDSAAEDTGVDETGVDDIETEDASADDTAVENTLAENTVTENTSTGNVELNNPAEDTPGENPTEKTSDKSSITIDDLIKVAAKKIKKKGNSEKIAALVKSYGKATLKEIPPEKFEAFMTDLAEI